jgi:hypothetical protein
VTAALDEEHACALHIQMVSSSTKTSTYATLRLLRRQEVEARNAKSLKLFARFQFVLGVYFYLITAVLVLVVFVVPILSLYFLRSPVYASQGSSLYATTRCEWWNIPRMQHSEEMRIDTLSMPGFHLEYFFHLSMQSLC